MGRNNQKVKKKAEENKKIRNKTKVGSVQLGRILILILRSLGQCKSFCRGKQNMRLLNVLLSITFTYGQKLFGWWWWLKDYQEQFWCAA